MSQKIIPTSLRTNHGSGTEISLFAEKDNYAKIWMSHWSLRRWSQLMLQSSLRFRNSSAPSRFRRKKSLFNLSKLWTKTSFNKIQVFPIFRAYARTGLVWKYSPVRITHKKKNNQLR